MSTGLEGWDGTLAWTSGKRFRNMRALFPMYDNPFQAVVLQRSGIATLAQLDKKRIGVGPRSGNGATYAPGIFKIVGISAELSYGSYNTIASELLDGRIDALLTLLGAPVPAIEDVDAKEPVKFLNLSPNKWTPSVKRCRYSALQRSRVELPPPGQGLCHRRSA